MNSYTKTVPFVAVSNPMGSSDSYLSASIRVKSAGRFLVITSQFDPPDLLINIFRLLFREVYISLLSQDVFGVEFSDSLREFQMMEKNVSVIFPVLVMKLFGGWNLFGYFLYQNKGGNMKH